MPLIVGIVLVLVLVGEVLVLVATVLETSLKLTLSMTLTDAMHQLPIQTLFPSSLFHTLYAPRTADAKIDKVFNIILTYSRV